MTIVSRSGHSPGAGPLDGGGVERQGASGRERRKDMHGFAQFDFSEDALLRGDDFAQRGEGDASPRDPHERSKPHKNTAGASDERVLASAAGAQSAFAPPPIASDAGAALDVSGAGRLDAILARVEQALSASLYTGGEGPQSLTLRLDDLHAFGLHSLQIALSADRLDVTLGRVAGDLAPGALAAAQGLAQQLAIRFPTRVVRILDTDPDRREGDAESSSGLQAIAAMLRTRSELT